MADKHEEKDWYTEKPKFPTIVCLCGSTRFKDAFEEANFTETMAGNIVLMPGHFTHAVAQEQTMTNHAFCSNKVVSGDKEDYFGAEVAAKLETLYLRKIDLCNEVVVLNVGGYIGKSTQAEIDYAMSKDKILRFLVPVPTSSYPYINSWDKNLYV